MPEWVAQGIAEGIYEVVGGVVRRVDGKQVVLWLRPAMDAVGTPGLPALRPLGMLGGGAALSLATTAGVAIIALAGFAYIAHQNRQARRRLDEIIANLGLVNAGLNTLLAAKFARVQHDVEVAFETIQMEEDRAGFDALQAPITDLRKAQKFYAGQMRRLLDEPTPLAFAPTFVELASLFVLAAQAKLRALTLYAGEAAAETDATDDQATFAALRTAYLRPLAEPEAFLAHFAQLTEQQDAEMRQHLPLLPRPEALEFIRMSGLSRDPVLLKALRDVATPRAGEPAAGIIPAGMAPPGWAPELAS